MKGTGIEQLLGTVLWSNTVAIGAIGKDEALIAKAEAAKVQFFGTKLVAVVEIAAISDTFFIASFVRKMSVAATFYKIIK